MIKVNEQVIDSDYIQSFFRFQEFSQINGGNTAQEPSQNAHDYESTDFGFINDLTHIYTGNNGKPLPWPEFVDYFVYIRKKVGARVGKTGHWCIGGSIVLPMRWGIQDYVLTIIGDKYMMYKFNWTGIDLTKDITRLDIANITSLTIEGYELTEEEYKSKIPNIEFFKETPTFFFAIKKRIDNGIDWSPKAIIKNLNLSFVNSRADFRYWIKDAADKDKTTGSNLYFPTIKDGQLVGDVTELTQVNVDENGKPGLPIEKNGGLWDVYYYKFIDTKWTIQGHELDKLSLGKELWYPHGWSPSVPGNHFFNQQKIYYSSDRLNSSSPGDISGAEYNFGQMIWIARSEYPWPGIKSDQLPEEDRKNFENFHKEYVDDNDLALTGKHEDNKIDEFTAQMNDNKHPNYYQTHRSFVLMSDKQYDVDKFEDGGYTIESREDFNEREHDLNIFEKNETIPFFHLEATETLDWGHIDKFCSYVLDDRIPYNILEVDENYINSKKIKVLKKRLEEYSPIGVKKVYVVRKKDVISFNKTKLLQGLIYEKK
jgi:hypothetical protein